MPLNDEYGVCIKCYQWHYLNDPCPGSVTYTLKDHEKNKKKSIEKQPDLVNNPPHYKIPGTDIEALDVIRGSLTREEYIGYLRGNILKYHIRARLKGGEESMQKANYYSKELEEILNDTV